MFPKTLKSRQARILRYESELRGEQRQFGAIEIFRQLQTEPRGSHRTALVDEASRLGDGP